MEPRIQYAKTSDGVNIAYAVFGDGPSILFTPAFSGVCISTPAFRWRVEAWTIW